MASFEFANLSEQKRHVRQNLKGQSPEAGENSGLEEQLRRFPTELPLLTRSSVGCYSALPGELDIALALRNFHPDLKLYFPKITGDEISFYSDLEGMRPGPLGILEPNSTGDPLLADAIDLIFVPGCGFDYLGHRLGKGRGYYDRFLPKTGALRVGVCARYQLLNQIPCGEQDADMDYLLTPRAWLKTRPLSV